MFTVHCLYKSYSDLTLTSCKLESYLYPNVSSKVHPTGKVRFLHVFLLFFFSTENFLKFHLEIRLMCKTRTIRMCLAMVIKIRKLNGAEPTDFILIFSVKSIILRKKCFYLFLDCNMSVLNYSKEKLPQLLP